LSQADVLSLITEPARLDMIWRVYSCCVSPACRSSVKSYQFHLVGQHSGI